MSEILKSAFGYFNAEGTQGAENDFVGQLVEIGNVKLKVKRIIAEGGFAYVYAVQDPNSGKDYALKRLIATDKEANAAVIQEINIMKQLSGHGNIVQYLAAAAVNNGSATEYLLLMELCPHSLVECLGNSTFPVDVVARVFWQTCKAVQHMHSQVPVVIHRDLKLENLLISSEGSIKLCDFGSCTLQTIKPDEMWNASQRANLEDQMARFTTPMYRAPEMVDTWNNYVVGSKADIWALGCLLYTLCFNNHPFADGSKLKILNANFSIPSGDGKFAPFHDIIRGCLVADPSKRLSISEILDRLSAINESFGYDMRAALKLAPKPKENVVGNSAPVAAPAPAPAPARPPPPREVSAAPPRNSDNLDDRLPQAGLFSSIKGGAGSFFKNLKTTSSKVISTVQQSMARCEMDLSYITSRLMVMPFPGDGLEVATGSRVNHVDDVRDFLETRYPGGRYCVINLSGRSYPPSRLGHGPVKDIPFGGFRRVPPLSILYSACVEVLAFLEQHPKSAVIIHDTDGKAFACVLVASLLMYTGVTPHWQDAVQMFAVKRTPPQLQPSDTRYVEYMGQLLETPPKLPHTFPVTLETVTLSPVPLFTKMRDGCRPYVEVYQGDQKVKSTLIEYERMRVYHVSEGKVILNLGVLVSGDVTVSVLHARQNLGGVMTAGRPTGHRIAQFQFHTGYLPKSQRDNLVFTRIDLDEPAEPDHYLDGFRVELSIQMAQQPIQIRPMPWESPRHADPILLFANSLEMEETIETFAVKPVPPPKTAKPPTRPPRPPKTPAAPLTPPAPVSPPTETDLFNIQQPIPKPARQESVDLLGLGDDNAPIISSGTQPAPQLLSNLESLIMDPSAVVAEQEASTAKPAPATFDNFFFDPFAAPTIQPPVAPVTAAARPRDPFADFGNLGASLNVPGSSKTASPVNGTPIASPNIQSPVHTPYNLQKPNDQQQVRSPVNPDYSRSHFDSLNPKKTAGAASGGGDFFGDLLGSQGYDFASKKDSGPRTMNQLRKEDMVKEMDPDRIKILEWTSGKKGNIRALLCSINNVLWSDCRWKGVDMAQLVTAADVKKAYRKACLAVHPDKQLGTENEHIAKLIFVELNNAWSDFESDASQQNLFAA